MKKICIGILVFCLMSPTGQVKAVDGYKVAGIAGTFLLGSVIGAGIAKILYDRAQNNDPFTCTKVSQKFDDFIGQDEVTLQAKRVIEAFLHADVAEKLGAKRVRGILIEGPRGNGKTLLANIIATELNAKVMTVNAAALGDKHNFEGELEFIFSKAQGKAKRERIVLLFDHVENFQSEEQFNVLLKQLEHVTEKNLIVIGEANERYRGKIYFDEINEQQVFNSNLSKKGVERIRVFCPNLEGRKKILAHYLKGIKISSNFPVEEMIQKWGQVWSCASIAFLRDFVQSAALRAAQQGATEVEAKHFDEVFFECVGGLKKNSIRTPEELKRIAIHESGHILATILTGTRVRQVTVVSHENFGGYAGWDTKHENWNAHVENDFLVMVISLLGSYAAEKIIYGQTTGGTCSDLFEVDNILNQMVKEFGMGSGELEGAIWNKNISDEMKKKFDQDVCEKRLKCLKAACTVLENHKAELEKLAQRLVEKLVLNEQEIYEIVGQPRNEVASLL